MTSYDSYYCYLIKSIKKNTSTSTYIGFSTNPINRLRQHNGEITQGARKTKKNAPWIHIVIVKGFPNKIIALQFEWQWQHYNKSRIYRNHIKNLSVNTNYNDHNNKIVNHTNDNSIIWKAKNTTISHEIKHQICRSYKSRLKILFILLQIPLWKQLNLTLHFKNQEYYDDYNKLIDHNYNNSILLHITYNQIYPSLQYIHQPIDISIVNNNSSNNNNNNNNNNGLVDRTLQCILCSNYDYISTTATNNNHNTDSNMNNRIFWQCNACFNAYHITCLARSQYKTNTTTNNNYNVTNNNSNKNAIMNTSSLVIPTSIQCFYCKVFYHWSDIVKTSSYQQLLVHNIDDIVNGCNSDKDDNESDDDDSIDTSINSDIIVTYSKK